jgi:hypothetical protein
MVVRFRTRAYHHVHQLVLDRSAGMPGAARRYMSYLRHRSLDALQILVRVSARGCSREQRPGLH